jgi:hypothetical protein
MLRHDVLCERTKARSTGRRARIFDDRASRL